MNIFKEFRNIILEAILKIFTQKDLEQVLGNIVIEAPKDDSHGDLATNAAMILAPKLHDKNPRSIAEKISGALKGHRDIREISIAGPGFINIKLTKAKWQACVKQIVDLKSHYGDIDIGQGASVNIEYVSCNPTGPMHIGHARGAVYGDVLANILQRCGFKIIKEFYINDAGSQVTDLAQTVFLRYQEALNKQEIQIPQGLYPGEYLIPVGQKLAKLYPNLTQNDLELIKEFATGQMLELIKKDLQDLGVMHEVFFSEKTLHIEKRIEQVIEKLTAKGFIYKGILPPPKGKVDNKWQAGEQMLFKTTQFGDDQDRTLQKSDGTWTYFAAEVAYFQDKIDRGFAELILVLGADHGGYIKRSQALVKAIDKRVGCVIKTCQLVNYMQNGAPIKMSKRSGDYVTVKDVIDLVGKDVIRFMMLTRKNDMIIDFDIELAKEYSKNNPVFYVQYAHVRTVSILNNASNNFPDAYKALQKEDVNLELLSLEGEIALIKKLAFWPKALEGSAIFHEPHRIVFYLQSLASQFHALWDFNQDGQSYRFIDQEDLQKTSARLMLVQSVKIIIAQGLSLMGVEVMEKM
jgi:arginyl-tRNA synthetase